MVMPLGQSYELVGPKARCGSYNDLYILFEDCCKVILLKADPLQIIYFFGQF